MDSPRESSEEEIVVKKVIQFSPSAGEIHRKESERPWRQQAKEMIHKETIEAQTERFEKRIWGLARQTQQGLLQSYGINYGIAELSTKLRIGMRQRRMEMNGEAVEKKDVQAAGLLLAVEQYDLKKIATLLGVKPNVASTSF